MNTIKGFVKAQGDKLVNGQGQAFILRGVGLGSWLLPEGYMWRFPEGGDRPRRIEKMVNELIGEEKAKLFWEVYFERYVAEQDIQQIAKEGFNSIRVPINSRILLDDTNNEYNEWHLKLIDNVIKWCKKSNIYVILDLHGAPGGQTGTNIDDSENNKPELFIDEENKKITISLWRMLAERYKDEPIVAGYDLLNEPLPEWFSMYNNQVMELYKEIVAAIREVDHNHLIILEGVHWSTDWSIFNEKIDDNMMLQFHKYWNNPDIESIQVYLDKRKEWNVPIFMGEGGENNKDWYVGAFRLFDQHDISWNFWTWKKMDTDNSPCSINMPADWHKLVDYLDGGIMPDIFTAERILWDYLDQISFERCVYHQDVARALLCMPPVRIPAIFYGYKGVGKSFNISDRANKAIGFRENDGMHFSFIQGNRTKPNFHHGRGEAWQEDERLCIRLNPGDWVAYEFSTNSANDASFTIDMNVYTLKGKGKLSIMLDETNIETLNAEGTSWKVVSLENGFNCGVGQHLIIIKALDNPICVEWLEIKPLKLE